MLFDKLGISTTGKDHIEANKPNQDAFRISPDGEIPFVALTADGCGSSDFSQFGSLFGVYSLSRIFFERAQFYGSADRMMEQLINPVRYEDSEWVNVATQWEKEADAVVRSLGGDHDGTVEKFMYFTILGVIATQTTFLVFSFGDGTVAVNGNVFELAPMPSTVSGNENAPPYIGYRLLHNASKRPPEEQLRFQTVYFGDTKYVNHFLIGSDGLDFFAKNEESLVPGTKNGELVGPISQFWEKDEYFDNPEIAIAKLKACAQPIQVWGERVEGVSAHLRRMQNAKGFLKDDITLISGRKVHLL